MIDLMGVKASRNRSSRFSGGSARWLKLGGVSLAALCTSFYGTTALATETGGAPEVEEVVVTAQKRAESIQDVPVSITAFTSEQLEARGVDSARDLSAPNFVFPQIYTTSRSYISMRGIFQEVNNILFDGGVSSYLDGVYMGRNMSYDADVGDVDHVEILRGPQGTLFGKNTIGGAINTVTKDPTGELEGRVTAEMGNLDLARFRGMLNIPLVQDKLAARVSVQSARRDGYVDNVTRGTKEGDVDILSGRAKVRFTPMPQLAITATYDYLKSDYSGYVSEIVAAESTVPALGDDRKYTTHSEVDQLEYKRDQGGSLTAEYTFANDITLTSVTGVRKTRTRWVIDDDASALDMLTEDTRDEQKLWSQELRLNSPGGGRFEWVAGLYYYDELARSDDRVRLGPDYTPSPNFIVLYADRVKTIDQAAFAHVNYQLLERLSIFGGLRYTREVKTLVGDRLVRPSTFDVGPGFIVDPPLGLFRSRITENNTSYTIGAEYEVNDDVMAYGKVATGFKSGGWNIRNGQPVNPEYLTSYEMGVKTMWFDRRVRLNVAAFLSDYEDLQVRSLDLQSLTVVLHNAAEVEAKGFEVDLQAIATENLRLNLGVGYVDSRYESFENTFDIYGQASDFSGNRLPMTPPWTVNGGFTYDRPLASGGALVWHGDFNFIDSRYATLDAGQNGPGYKLPSYAVLNTRVGYRSPDEKWSIFAWSKNLTDEDVPVDRRPTPLIAGVTEQFATYLEPRTYGVTLTAEF